MSLFSIDQVEALAVDEIHDAINIKKNILKQFDINKAKAIAEGVEHFVVKYLAEASLHVHRIEEQWFHIDGTPIEDPTPVPAPYVPPAVTPIEPVVEDTK